VLVDLFANHTGDPALDAVGQMASDWVVRGLAEIDLVDVIDASTASALARGGTAGADSAGGRGRLLGVADAMGARTLVVGRYYRRGDSLEFQAQVVDARGGAVLRSVPPAAGLLAAPGAVVGVHRSRVMAGQAASSATRRRTRRTARCRPAWSCSIAASSASPSHASSARSDSTRRGSRPGSSAR
jgi:hypothetical protein